MGGRKLASEVEITSGLVFLRHLETPRRINYLSYSAKKKKKDPPSLGDLSVSLYRWNRRRISDDQFLLRIAFF